LDLTSFLVVIKTLRVHQWVKNLLIFIPFILAFKQVDLSRLWDVLLAFIAFCLCASASYIINDISDLESDRQHPLKQLRPIAAGAITQKTAYLLAIVALLLGVGIAATLSLQFQLALMVYLFVTLAYSFFFKSVVLLDVVVLGSLYTVRIIAGIFAANVAISYWILVFSMFMFISLAMLKRYSELYNLRKREEETALGRGYIAKDLELVSSLGAAAGYIAVLIMVLYIHDPVNIEKYSKPDWLWLVFPALLYWVSRMWLIAHRGMMHEDPVLYALHDRPSYLVGAVCLLGFGLAI